MTHAMSDEERRTFLLHGTRTAKVATVRADGGPHLAPVWFTLDVDDVVFTTGARTVKGRTLQRDPRVSLCVDDEDPPFSFVTIEGSVELSTNLDDLRHWATVIGRRYMGSERADEFGRRNAASGELLVRVRPLHIVAQAGLAD
jgi:PPOX class probable F420-dependent enzyme